MDREIKSEFCRVYDNFTSYNHFKRKIDTILYRVFFFGVQFLLALEKKENFPEKPSLYFLHDALSCVPRIGTKRKIATTSFFRVRYFINDILMRVLANCNTALIFYAREQFLPPYYLVLPKTNKIFSIEINS